MIQTPMTLEKKTLILSITVEETLMNYTISIEECLVFWGTWKSYLGKSDWISKLLLGLK